MSLTRYAVGFRIEGVGSDTSKSEGICWYYGRDLGSAILGASSYEWVGGAFSGEGLIAAPEGIDFSVDIWTGELQGNAMDIELHLSDLAAETFLFQPFDSTIYLGEILGPTEPDIDILGPAADLPADDSVVWVGDEAILLGTSSGITGGRRYLNCVRGHWGTSGVRLVTGQLVFTSCPFFNRRVVTMVLVDRDTGAEEVRWLGIVEDLETSDDGTRLTITTQEIWGALSQASINRGSPDLRSNGDVLVGTFGADSERAVADGVLTLQDIPKRVAKRDVHGHKQAFYVAGGLFFADESQVTTTANTPVTYVEFEFRGAVAYKTSGEGVEGPELGRRLERVRSARPDRHGTLTGRSSRRNLAKPTGGIFEVLAILRDLDEDGDTSRHATTADYFSATRSLTYPFHPIEIAMALLTSGQGHAEEVGLQEWDVFAPDFGLGVPLAWFDTAQIAAMVERTASLKIDQLVLGWEGEEVAVWEEVKRLLTSYGFFLGTTSAGKLTVLQAKEADVEQFASRVEVLPIPFTLQERTRRGEVVDIISGVANKLPWTAGEPFVARAVDFQTLNTQTSLRAGLFSEARRADIDMSTRADVRGVLADLVSGLITRRQSWPRLVIEVGDSDSYDLGAFVIFAESFGNSAQDRLTAPWFVDRLGSRAHLSLTVQDDPQWLGLIVGRTHNLERGTYTLEVLMSNKRLGNYPLWRSPAMHVTNVTTTTLSNDTFHCAAVSQFGYVVGGVNTPDAQAFTMGDVVIFTDQTGELRSGSSNRTISVVGATTVQVSSGSTFVPAVGDVMTLANLDSGYPQTGNAAIFNVLAYAFQADDSDTLTTSQLAGHVYGSGRA